MKKNRCNGFAVDSSAYRIIMQISPEKNIIRTSSDVISRLIPILLEFKFTSILVYLKLMCRSIKDSTEGK